MAINIGKSLTKSAVNSASKSATKGAIAGGLSKLAGSYAKTSLTKGATSGILGSLVDIGTNWLTGGGSTGTSTGGSIFEAMLGGLNTAAGSYLSKEAAEELGKQERRTFDFKAALEDYYLQKNKVRKRAALDTYGQFSTMDRWAPGAKPAPSLDQPIKPGY